MHVSEIGIVKIQFDKKMTNYTLSNLNKTIIDIWVEPYNDWHLDNDDENPFNMTKLNFTWEAQKFEQDNTYLYIKLKFISPAYISPKRKYDKLVIDFKRNDTMVSILNETLHQDSIVLKYKIRKQMPNDEYTIQFIKNIESGKRILDLSILV